MNFGTPLNSHHKHFFEDCIVMQYASFGNEQKSIFGRINGVLSHSLNYKFVLVDNENQIIDESSAILCDTHFFGNTLRGIIENTPRFLLEERERISNSEIKVSIEIERNFFFKNQKINSKVSDWHYSASDLKQILFLNIEKHFEVLKDPYKYIDKKDFLLMTHEENIAPAILISLEDIENNIDSILKSVYEQVEFDIQKFNTIVLKNEALFFEKAS